MLWARTQKADCGHVQLQVYGFAARRADVSPEIVQEKRNPLQKFSPWYVGTRWLSFVLNI